MIRWGRPGVSVSVRCLSRGGGGGGGVEWGREPVGPICWSAAAAAAVCGCPDVPSSTAVPTAQLPRPRLLDWDFLGAVACLWLDWVYVPSCWSCWCSWLWSLNLDLRVWAEIRKWEWPTRCARCVTHRFWPSSQPQLWSSSIRARVTALRWIMWKCMYPSTDSGHP